MAADATSIDGTAESKSESAVSRALLRSPQLPLAIGFLLLLAIGAALVFLSISSHRFNASVTHTLEVRSTAYRLLTLVQDAETGERGYLLTGNPIYLEPYDLGRVQAPRVLDELRGLLAGDMQKAALARLSTALKAKLEDLAQTTTLRREGKAEEALRHVNTNTGNAIMQQIRVDVASIEAEEIRAENRLMEGAEYNGALLAAASLAGLVAVFALAAFAIMLTRRGTRELRHAQEDLRCTNENLEGLVAERVSELQMANEEIQRFAYIVSHDLRAPLVNVMGFTSELDALKSDVAAFLKDVEREAPHLVTPERREAIETDLPEALGFIRTSTAKMDRLINAILKLSREGRRVLTPQPIDIRELVEAQGESLSQQLSAQSAELIVQPDLPNIASDRLAVEQIFGNLIENAVKYLAPGRPGRITVSGKPHGLYVRYDIADNGRGIDAKDFERIFELFRRSGEQDKPGEGIGLAYVRNLARRLGGNVSVQSTFGQGSTFTVTLPATFQAKTRQTR